MNLISRLFNHVKTIERHRRQVRKLCFKCGLYWQGLTHDLSKYSPVEFINGVRFYTGKYSPHLGERSAYGYSKAWLNHKGHNKHHAEYWQDILPNGKSGNIDMPAKYFVEMICDRIGASKVYLGKKYTDRAPLEYYKTHKDENQFTTETRKRLELVLNMLAVSGEETTVNYLKNFKNRM